MTIVEGQPGTAEFESRSLVDLAGRLHSERVDEAPGRFGFRCDLAQGVVVARCQRRARDLLEQADCLPQKIEFVVRAQTLSPATDIAFLQVGGVTDICLT